MFRIKRKEGIANRTAPPQRMTRWGDERPTLRTSATSARAMPRPRGRVQAPAPSRLQPLKLSADVNFPRLAFGGTRSSLASRDRQFLVVQKWLARTVTLTPELYERSNMCAPLARTHFISARPKHVDDVVCGREDTLSGGATRHKYFEILRASCHFAKNILLAISETRMTSSELRGR